MSVDPLKDKKIILGVTGGIAAYKSALIIRELVSRGAEVRVLMTPSALQFITPLTLSTLSKNRVIINTFPPNQSEGTDYSTWHIDYGMWADLMLIAPATVNTIAKISAGFADNALTTVVSALRSPLIIAPAADMDMYNNKINRENIRRLEENGTFIVEAEEGFLASGLLGAGRMADVQKIVDSVELVVNGYTKDLSEKNILVTAGPSYEDIDPVRFIGNRSSGKMGYAIAKAAYLRGANVTLISGPSSEKIYPEIELIRKRSAAEIKEAVTETIVANEILIMAAAIADYKPAEFKQSKIKKENKLGSIELKETDDILSSLKREGKTIVGFALETDDLVNNAKKKLRNKNLDLIAANSSSETEKAFEEDTNKITILGKGNYRKDYPKMSKFQAANKILSEIKQLL